ncbi:MAG: hypothetical protein DLM59_17105 [Pseudonocardiales bacterium]|nr:MAG: hypothetical protein DLM59_17105 [Pseudonocardiales bacterium]
MTQPTTASPPSFLTGTWTIDPVHSHVSFLVRHMMVSKVRGHFNTFEGQIVTAEDPLQSSATASIDLTSIDTGNEQRDNHVRSADFFDVDNNPAMTYRSTGISKAGENYRVDGELTVHGVTRSVPLTVELGGFGPDPFGGTRVGFSATGEINRRDFGIDFSMPLDGGGVVLGDKVQIALEIEAVLDQK